MATKRNDAFIADFDAKYSRWLAVQESNDEAELKEAASNLPTLNASLLAKLAALDEDEPDPEIRAAQKRLLVLASEIRADEAKRRRKRRETEKRRRDRTIRVARTTELPTKCARCGTKLEGVKNTGRPRLYCSPACRKAAYEDRRAHRDVAVQVKVVEKVVTEVRERRIEVPHPRSDCVKAVLADDDAMLAVVWTLTTLVRDHTRSAYSAGEPRFKNLSYHAEALREALIRRARDSQS